MAIITETQVKELKMKLYF